MAENSMSDTFDYLNAAKTGMKPEETGLDGMELRNYNMLVRRVSGLTLEEIADEYGFTRERVRQILKKITLGQDKQLLKDAKENREKVEKSQSGDISKLIWAHPGINMSELMQKTNLTETNLRKLVDRKDSKLILDFKAAREQIKTWSDEQVLKALQEAATHFFPLGKSDYDSLIELKEVVGPSSALIWMRFGSWSKACEIAGVECHTVRDHYQKTWSRDELLTYITRFLMSSEPSSSIGSYESWKHKETAKTPSGQLLRVEYGTWQNVVQVGLEKLRGTWQSDV